MSKYENKVKKHSQSRIKETMEVDSAFMDAEWVKCPKCYEEIKSNNLERHLGKVHSIEMVEKDKKKNDIKPVVGLMIVILIVLATGFYFFISADNNEVDTHIEEPTQGWIDYYSPKETIGSSEDNWWTTYPSHNPNHGGIVDHPSWIIDRLKDGPILLFAHSDDCVPCIQQEESVKGIMKSYGNDIQLLDLLSGKDPKASDAFRIYDPNGSPNYIPLTVIITIVEDRFGNERIAWHGIEGATGGEWLTNYVKDAIYYHQQNVDEWS